MTDETQGQPVTPDQLVADHTKPELVTAAEVVGAEPVSSDTKADLAEKVADAVAPAPAAPVPAPPNDETTTPGQWVDVVDGEHKGRRGHFLGFEGVDRAIVRTRDEFNQLLSVLHKHLRPSKFTGGR